jgi:cyclopropane-fatty-acyl-phospholipid synthase
VFVTLWQKAYDLAERAPIPDPIVRLGIGALVGRTSRQLALADRCSTDIFAKDLERLPVAIHTDAANDQHYEVPAQFFGLVLGPQRKYSCSFYDGPDTTLGEAEERALALTAEHAGLSDGQTVLELGCGWGSFSFWMARTYPQARILAVSNSRSQRSFIEGKARDEGLDNLEVVTADMNTFASERQFDRIVSIEMFEHMANWRELLSRCRRWLASDGRMFMHVFTHRDTPYRFDHSDKNDWIAQHFFTGGCMPSRALIRGFPDLFDVEHEWYWEGTHYSRTAEIGSGTSTTIGAPFHACLSKHTGPMLRFGSDGGATSSLRRRDCSGSTAAANGASVTICCGPHPPALNPAT